ncbi:MAG: hypothetical protein NW220_05385 [Leptolyngbyaceae cyanobacterium bins.349]|nr:hypothetical protein [Leptolyngbyaceae cyanobacterium bins.349]
MKDTHPDQQASILPYSFTGLERSRHFGDASGDRGTVKSWEITTAD